MKSLKKTYFIAIAASLVPAWIGSALMSKSDNTLLLEQDLFAQISICLFLLGFWGTSWAFIYLRYIKYAVISGIGKLVIILGSVLIYQMTQGNGHPYLIFLGIALAMFWGMVDFFILSREVRKINKSN